MSTRTCGVISRRRFLGGLGAAALAAAGAAAWIFRGSRQGPGPAMPPTEQVASDVRTEFKRAWDAYARLAWGHDELMPQSGTYREFFASGNPVGLTIVESLDTLYLMGLDDEFDRAVSWTRTSLDLDVDAPFQVFEAVIRMLGGLLAGHLASHDAALLAKARELADRRITVNCVHPLRIDTARVAPGDAPHAAEHTPIGRFGTVEEVAALVRFLCGPDGGYITGQNIFVNGGAYMP